MAATGFQPSQMESLSLAREGSGLPKAWGDGPRALAQAGLYLTRRPTEVRGLRHLAVTHLRAPAPSYQAPSGEGGCVIGDAVISNQHWERGVGDARLSAG